MTLRLIHEHDRRLSITREGVELLSYVYRPDEPQLESPRPFLHPLRTVNGRLVTLYRPHDHVWHKGIAWSMPNVGSENFWGGTTYRRGRGYEQLPNNGATVHREFTSLDARHERVAVAEKLDWVTQAGQTWFSEDRRWTVAEGETAWTLTWGTTFTNVSDAPVVMGSPTTQGRPNAGYGGLFWRGPRSFTGGKVHVPGRQGADELMGVRGPWMGFCGRYDGDGGHASLVFADHPGNGPEPTRWFVRSAPFACVCPAPYFDTEDVIAPGRATTLRYAVTIADGDPGPAGIASLADTTIDILTRGD